MRLMIAGIAGVLSVAAVSGTFASAQASVTAAGHTAARASLTSASRSAAPADSPAGFWYGTDSHTMSVTGPAPYREPAIGGPYGGYIGMVGNWASWSHCAGDTYVWSTTNAAQARTNYVRYHQGIGVGAYWFMGGPGVDPHYTGTTAEASAWGAAQAARVLYDIPTQVSKVTYPVVIMDVEIPGYAPGYTPAQDNGWNAVYTSPCSGVKRTNYVPTNVDRADLNGFAAYIVHHSSYHVGVYSAPGIWTSIFGSGSDASIPNTYEWTYTQNTSSLAHHPVGWCLQGTSTCAQFFGGVTSGTKYALAWQWSGGGGTYNGYGDFDQIDANRTP